MKKLKKIMKLIVLCIKKPKTIIKGIRYLQHNGVRQFVQNMKLRASDQRLFVEEPIRFSILMPVYKVDVIWLNKAIQSVENQTYKNWELCIAEDFSQDENLRKYLDSKTSEKIKILYLEENKGISDASNAAAKLATGEYILLMDNDDIIAPNALEEFYNKILQTNADIIYSDQDIIDTQDNHRDPLLKPDWSYDLFLSQMYMGHLLGFKRDLFCKVNGFNSTYNGAQDYDLILRMLEITKNVEHIDKILYSWRALPSSTAENPDSKPYAQTAGQYAILNHLNRTLGEGKADVWETDNLFVYDVRYHIDHSPLVSIIIPTMDHIDLLKKSIDSILKRTSYQKYEILILNNCSLNYETYEYFNQLEKEHKNIRIVNAYTEFNWSKINNIGIREACGEVYVFLNNDVEIISEDWLTRLVENAVREDIGVVGGLLLYEDGTIQHAGVVIGIGGWADHIYKGMEPAHRGTPYISPMVTRNVSAVTGACMAISKKTMEKVGGFNEDFIICGSDIEICVKAINAGLRNVYIPHVRLYHFESKSRDSYIPEIDFKMSYILYEPYRDNGDPFYNKQLENSTVIPTIDYKKLPMYMPVTSASNEGTTEVKLKQSIDTNIHEITPYTFRNSNYPRRRINLLVPSINVEHVFGGISTAIKFFDTLCEKSGFDRRIIITDAFVSEQAKADYIKKGYDFIECDEEKLSEKQIVPYCDRYGKSLPVSENDYFILTGWWTAHCCQEAYTKFNKKPNLLLYFIQDYEPGFYPWSSRYLLADASYRSNFEHIAIFNTKLLYDYFKLNGYSFAHEYSFEPSLNKALKDKLLSSIGKIKKKKQIIVYGRPSVDRNAFNLLVNILKKWVENYEECTKWEVLSAGEYHEPIPLGNNMALKSVGKLSIENYAQLLLDSYAGVSLMVSPHPSYPPLEMSVFGVKVITNVYHNKDLSTFNQNIISLKQVNFDSASQKLKEICDNYCEDQMLEITNKDYCSDLDMFPFLEDIIDLLK